MIEAFINVVVGLIVGVGVTIVVVEAVERSKSRYEYMMRLPCKTGKKVYVLVYKDFKRVIRPMIVEAIEIRHKDKRGRFCLCLKRKRGRRRPARYRLFEKDIGKILYFSRKEAAEAIGKNLNLTADQYIPII